MSFLSWEGLQHLVLPATNLALFNLALLIRLTRSGAHEALLQDYVKFARAKGLTNARVIGVHVLRNILIPIVTVIGLQWLAPYLAYAILSNWDESTVVVIGVPLLLYLAAIPVMLAIGIATKF